MKRLLALLALVATPAFASPCDQFFPNGKEIVVTNTVVLCSEFFVTVFDTKNNANVFSSEITTPRTNRVARKNDFRADKRITAGPTPED